MFRQIITKPLCKRFMCLRSYSKPARLENTKAEWEAVIGLEIHAQISAGSKLFSGSSTNYGGPINQQVAPLDAALPGTLPVLNKRCVEAGVKTALALKCDLNMVSMFDRKHYFYADLPAGYQITQQRRPLGCGGRLDFIEEMEDGSWEERSVRITQLQLEQDSGKSLHDPHTATSFIDLNRAGVGLMEIVTEPDLRSGNEALRFVRDLQLLLLALDTCDCKMEEGSLRVDASVSVRRPGEPLGTRAEVKNINSARYVAQAIDFEIERQIELIENGGVVENETRAFDYTKKCTRPLRDKERLHDYRFMPEPNLPPVRLTRGGDAGDPVDAVDVSVLEAALPELPAALRARLMDAYSLPFRQANQLVTERELWGYFEATMEHVSPDLRPVSVANSLLNIVLGLLSDGQRSRDVWAAHSLHRCLPPQSFAEIWNMLHEEHINATVHKRLLRLLVSGEEPSSARPRELVERRGWRQLGAEGELRPLVDTVFQENAKAVSQLRKGKKKVMRFLTRKVQEKCDACAHPTRLEEVIQKAL